MKQPVTVPVEPPLFDMYNEQNAAAAAPDLHDVETSCRLALLVNVPKSPNTNPAMATAATSVIAMSMTVARIGEMAFLLPCFSMFIVKVVEAIFAY